MGNRGNQCPLFLPNLKDLHHEGNVSLILKPIRHMFAQDRRGEGAKGLSALDLAVKDLLHGCTPRIADDGAIAESSRTPFHASLKPPYYQSFRHSLRRTVT